MGNNCCGSDHSDDDDKNQQTKRGIVTNVNPKKKKKGKKGKKGKTKQNTDKSESKDSDKYSVDDSETIEDKNPFNKTVKVNKVISEAVSGGEFVIKEDDGNDPSQTPEETITAEEPKREDTADTE